MTSLRFDPKHGLNPSVTVCYYCLQETGIALFGELKGPLKGTEAPRRVYQGHTPCDECAAWMEKGIILIEVDEESEDMDNPRRCGGWAVVTEDAVRRLFDEEAAGRACQMRSAFVSTEAWDKVGLPREGTNTTGQEA